MGELDWVLVIIVGLSTLLGLTRGMVREIFALIGWLAAFFVSLYFSNEVAEALPFKAVGAMGRTLIAVILIVIGCVFVAGLVGKIIRKILSSVSVGAEDHLLGTLFGFLRGVLIVAILVYVCGATEFISKQSWWKSSELVPYVEKGIVFCSPYMPEWLSNMKK